jgi:hypothetical protein
MPEVGPPVAGGGGLLLQAASKSTTTARPIILISIDRLPQPFGGDIPETGNCF